MRTRRNFSVEFKSKVIGEVILGKESLQDLAFRYELNPQMVAAWKRRAIENVSSGFPVTCGRINRRGKDALRELYAQIESLGAASAQDTNSLFRNSGLSFYEVLQEDPFLSATARRRESDDCW